MLLTKKDFAAACGVSVPTVYKWIDRNRGGLRDFVTDGGIEAAALDREPFKQYRTETEAKHKQTVGGRLEELQADNTALTERLTVLQAENEKLAAQIAAQAREIERLEQHCEDLRTNADFLRTLAESVIKQPPALPERKTPLAWLKAKIEKIGNRHKANAAEDAPANEAPAADGQGRG